MNKVDVRTGLKMGLPGDHGHYQVAILGLALMLGGNGVSAAAQFMPTGTVLAFEPGILDQIGEPVSGSWFAFEVAPGHRLYTSISPGHDGGLIIGVPQPAYGSHSGCSIYGTEASSIDTPWCFFGNIGMHYSFGDGVTQDPADPGILDMSSWAATWNGLPRILLNESPTGGPGRAVIDCAAGCAGGDAFTLDYQGRVPLGDPSGFGGVPYILHMEGYVQTGAGHARIALENLLNMDGCVEAMDSAGSVVNVNGLASTDGSGGANFSYYWATDSGVSGVGVDFSFILGLDRDETVVLTTTDLATGDSSSANLHVCVSDTTPPIVVITRPGDGEAINSNGFSLSVMIRDAVDAAITSYDVEVHMATTVTLDSNSGESTVRLLKGKPGDEVMAMEVKVTASDASGNKASDKVTVHARHDAR